MHRLLSLLDERLKARGVAASIYVFGGAAIALTHGREGVTPDIDAVASHQAVREEAQALGRQEGLPDGWLNSAGAGWLPPRPAASLEKPTRPGLTVHFPPDEHLLAMKLVASRRKDAPDIARLARVLGMEDATAEDYAALLRAVYDGEDQLADILGVPDSELDNELTYIGRDATRIVAVTRHASSTPAPDQPESNQGDVQVQSYVNARGTVVPDHWRHRPRR